MLVGSKVFDLLHILCWRCNRRFAVRLIVGFALLMVTQSALSQSGRVKYNNQSLFLSGANFAWINFASDIGPGATDFTRFADIMLAAHDHGGNAFRWWLHTDGTVTPRFNDSGYVINPGVGTIADMRKVLDLAWEREIGVKLCLWSFDMLRTSIGTTAINRNRLLLTDTAYTRAYINNCLIPMVDSLKGHPAIIAWEIFNEPEGMSNEFGWSMTQHIPMSAIQRFVNLCAGAIHRRDSTALVTNGSWSFKALTDNSTAALAKSGSSTGALSPAEKREAAACLKEKNRDPLSLDQMILHLERVAGVTNFNYYSDSRLIAAGGDPKGTLDFYSVHYYTGIDPSNPTSISPFHQRSGMWGLTKPIVVAEFAMQTTVGIPKERLYDTLFQTGYAGALAWSWTDPNFSSVDDMLAGMQSLWDRHRSAVDILGISGMWPTVEITSPAVDARFPDSADVTIVAHAEDSDGLVVLVAFFVADAVKIGQVLAPPFTMVWKNVSPGLYVITAVATDNQGHQRTSNRVPIRVGTPDAVTPGLPVKFALEQNFPNPFNQETIVCYGLPVASHVSLVLYDVLGREVATLANEWQLAGSYSFTFDASMHGRRAGALSSGVYYYRIFAGAFR